MTCTAGKILENNTCNTAVTNIRGLVYSVNISFALSPPFVVNTTNNESLTGVEAQALRRMVERLENHVRSFNVTLFMDTLPMSGVPDDFGAWHVVQIRVAGDVTAPRDISRDEAELSIVTNLFFERWNITVNDNTSVLEQKTVDHTTEIPLGTTHSLDIEYYDSDSDSFARVDPSFPPDLKVKLTPMLICPHIEFSPSEYEIQMAGESEADTELLLIFGETKSEVKDLQQTWLDGERLYVCHDALESLERPQKRRGSGELSWQYLLTMVMMPLSMLCLVLTLIAYSLLPALRTQPGLNTMGTCSALLTAQFTLLLATHRVTSGAWCQALGVVVHASWLSVFCWTSVCSLHMYRAFSAKTFHRSASGRRWRLARTIALTVLVPAAVAAGVLGVTFVTSDGTSVGYSSSSCFVADPLVKGLTVVLPVSLILLLNLVFFVLTVRRIRQVGRVLWTPRR